MHDGSSSISEKKAIAGVYEYFEKLLGGMDFEYEYRTPESADLASQRASLMNELEKISSREARIRLAFENGIDSLEEYKENKERLQRTRVAIQNQISELDSAASPKKPSKETILSCVRNVYDVIKDPDVDYDTKGTFMRSIVEDIVLDKKSRQLVFHLYIS